MIRTLAVLVLMAGCRCSPTPAEPADAPDPVVDAEIVRTVIVADAIKDCPDCAIKLRLAVRQLPGIERFDVALLSGRVTIDHRASVSTDTIVTAAAAGGFEVRVVEGQ